jgi:hypothetical protein
MHANVTRIEGQNVKNSSSGALLEVEMMKKCTALWCEEHFEVKMYKALQLRSTFGS